MNDVIRKVIDWKAQGNSIVFTNGCFDFFHPGHLYFLKHAAVLGDKLVVGINSDLSVTRIKGDGRPIIMLKERMDLLRSLRCVDEVVAFDEDTPEKLIGHLLPDVLVKGKDYEISNIVGKDIVIQNGGTVETIELLPDYSTTLLIERINITK